MTERLARRAFRSCASVLCLFAMLAIGTENSYAQRFQETFGSKDPVGEEGNAVIETSKGDLISAGTTNVSGSEEMLLISTNAHGNANWSYTYQFPSFKLSGATDVKEFPNGDLVVVGWEGTVPAPIRWRS